MLTVTIITLNEAQNLRRTLTSLQNYQRQPQSLLREIVILDSGSTDATAAIAAEFGVRFEFRKFDGYGSQKQAATALAKNDWVLNLDADEVPELSFWNGLERFFAQDASRCFAAKISRDTVFLGKTLKHGGASAQQRVRLFHRNHFDWNAADVHEDVMPKPTNGSHLAIAEISGNVLHYSWATVSDAVMLLDKLSTRAADKKTKAGVSSVALYSRFFVELFRSFILRAGFLDGARGFVFCFLMAFSHELKLMKIYETQNAS